MRKFLIGLTPPTCLIADLVSYHISKDGLLNVRVLRPFNRITNMTKNTLRGCSFCITEFEANKKPPYLPRSNMTVENRVGLGC